MKKIPTFVLIAALALMMAPVVKATADSTVNATGNATNEGHGEGHGEAAVGQIFGAADVDQDGVLTVDEYGEAGLAEMGLAFEDCDMDADGILTLDEYLALYRMHHPPGYDAEI